MNIYIYQSQDGGVTLNLKAKKKKDRALLELLAYQDVFCVAATGEVNGVVHDVTLHHNQSMQKRYQRGRQAEEL